MNKIEYQFQSHHERRDSGSGLLLFAGINTKALTVIAEVNGNLLSGCTDLKP